MKRHRGWILCLATATLAPATASAQPAPPVTGNTALAREWADKAKERFQAGDYAGAIDAVHEAENHFRAPTFTRLLAQAHEKLGKLVEAQKLYQSLADMTIADGSPPAWVTAKEDAKTQLIALMPRIPGLKLTVLGADVASLKVTLDGSAFDLSQLGRATPLNPGKHTLVVESAGRKRETRDLHLNEGSTEQPTIELVAVAAAPAGTVSTAAATTKAASSNSTETPSRARSMVGPLTAFGVGGAGLVVGAIAGGLSFAKAGDVRAMCGDNLVCPKSYRDEVEGGKSLGYVSTIGFAVAGVGAAVGVVLLLLPGSKKDEPARAALAVGPSFIGVKGAF